MDSLSKLGFTNIDKKTSYSSEAYLIHIEALSDEFNAYYEGIFGATVRGTGKAIRGSRDGFQMGRVAVKKLWEVIKKILNGFLNMLKQMWLDIGNQQQRMLELKNRLDKLEKSLSGIENNEDAGVDSHSYTAVTTRTMNRAGWNLKLPDDVENNIDAGFKRIRAKKDIKWEEGKGQLSNSVGTVAYFTKLMALRADGISPEDALVKVKTTPELFHALNILFKEAINVYKNNPEYAAIVGWSNKAKMWGAEITGDDQLIYQYFKVEDYGKYVAQAFSPAGAFISTNNKESFDQTRKRIADYKKLLTPLKERDIPNDKALEEFTMTTRYMVILFNFLGNLDVIKSLQMKAKKLNAILATVNRLSNLTKQDIENYRRKDADTRGNVVYGELDDEGNTKNDNQQASGQSYVFGFDEMLDELRAFSEDTYDLNYAVKNSNALADAGRSMGDLQNKDAYTTVSNQKYSDNGNLTRNQFKDTLKIDEKDVTRDGVQKGLKYLHSYLVQAGNLTFQEGRFFNTMSKIMCDTADEFIKLVEDDFLKDSIDKKPDEQSNNVTIDYNESGAHNATPKNDEGGK